MVSPIYAANMNEQQRTWFYAEYAAAKKDEVVGVLLSLFLGHFGIHRFYMGETGMGILYLLFCWTGIPTILGFIECFFMPGRVRAYNAAQAQIIANGIMASSAPVGYAATASTPPPPQANLTPLMCPSCGGAVQPGAAFCAHCGTATATAS